MQRSNLSLKKTETHRISRSTRFVRSPQRNQVGLHCKAMCDYIHEDSAASKVIMSRVTRGSKTVIHVLYWITTRRDSQTHNQSFSQTRRAFLKMRKKYEVHTDVTMCSTSTSKTAVDVLSWTCWSQGTSPSACDSRKDTYNKRLVSMLKTKKVLSSSIKYPRV